MLSEPTKVETAVAPACGDVGREDRLTGRLQHVSLAVDSAATVLANMVSYYTPQRPRDIRAAIQP